MRLPSVKTLDRIAADRKGSRRIRKILEDSNPFGSVCAVLARCEDYTRFSCGVETIPRGHNEKSPAIHYLNTGDSYTDTLMYVQGRGYVVGCWGDIVERGNYD